MIRIKLGQILNSKDVLPKLLLSELRIKTIVKIERLLIKIQKELEFIEKQHVELVKKYGETTDNSQWNVKAENIQVFTSEFNELLDLEIEVAEVEKLDVNEIGNVVLDTKDYVLIKPYINVE